MGYPPTGGPQWGYPPTGGPPWGAQPGFIPQRRSSRGPILLLVLGCQIIFVAGILTFLLAVKLSRHGALRDDGVHTIGNVVGTALNGQEEIQYSTPEGSFKIAMSRPKASDLLPDGGVEVIYDRNDPTIAKVRSQVPKRTTVELVLIITSVVTGGGVACIVTGIVMLRRHNRVPTGSRPGSRPACRHRSIVADQPRV
ncbi:MAG: hypothetical protein ACRDZ8_01270 [Acidimicrobiales bacterium]